jgi:hypothetical protein
MMMVFLGTGLNQDSLGFYGREVRYLAADKYL